MTFLKKIDPQKMNAIISTIFMCLLLAGASCKSKGIKFDPIWHVGDSSSGSIVPREPYPIVSCFDEEFNNFACLSEEKVKELLTLLHKARIPNKLKNDIINTIKTY